ncbi:uncharacterized protein LOC124355579 [Homalodisca vitripennis]|uniref:uncharacterized protein LOC124355579 n=1 Tax=Homalodisca vitripennis TaxID=197043 RepID=UPI001EEA8675|nr:uncharacterized protein LOC124355579 [Homalodisca vitripennis]
MSPILFNIYVDAALAQWRRKCSGMGISVGDRTLYTLHYADDQVILAQDPEDLEYMTRKLLEEYKKWGLAVNIKKTKYLCIGGQIQDLQLNSGEKISGCEEYIYLGTRITQDGKCEKMINDRIVGARRITEHLTPSYGRKM